MKSLRDLRTLLFLALATATASGCPGDTDAGSGTATTVGNTDTDPPPTTSTDPGSSTSSTTAPEDPPTAGSACGGPLGGNFADCVNGNTNACASEEATCLVNNISAPSWGQCTLACEDECDCWAPPATGTAISACEGVLPMGGKTCILDCNEDRQCPDGMRCAALTGVHRACVFDSDDLPETSSGGDPAGTTTSSGDESTTTTETDTGTSGDTGSGTESGSSSSSGAAQ